MDKYLASYCKSELFVKEIENNIQRKYKENGSGGWECESEMEISKLQDSSKWEKKKNKAVISGCCTHLYSTTLLKCG